MDCHKQMTRNHSTTDRRAPPGHPRQNPRKLWRPLAHCQHILLPLSCLSSQVLFILQAAAFGHLKKMMGKPESDSADVDSLLTLKGYPRKVPLSWDPTQKPSFVKG